MKNSNKNLPEYKTSFIYKACGIALGILLVAVAVLLADSCIEIYRSGETPFSRESVSEAFEKIAPVVYAAIIAVFGCGIFSLFYQRENKRLKASPYLDETINRLSARLREDLCEETAKKLKKEQYLRTALSVVSAVLYIIGSVFAVTYALTGGNLPTTDINGAIAKLAWLLLVSYALPLSFTFVSALLSTASRKREISLLKDALKTSSNTPAEKNVSTVHFLQKPQTRTIIRSAVLILGCTLVIFGILNGGNDDVVQKAIKICRECIGLG